MKFTPPPCRGCGEPFVKRWGGSLYCPRCYEARYHPGRAEHHARTRHSPTRTREQVLTGGAWPRRVMPALTPRPTRPITIPKGFNSTIQVIQQHIATEAQPYHTDLRLPIVWFCRKTPLLSQ